MNAIRQPAPAKVNLTLRVIGRRADGYHLLDSLVAFADEADVIELDVKPAPDRARESESLVVRGPFAAQLHDALADGARLSIEAAYEIARAAARPRRYGVDLTIEKNLPVAAGLGGGTSDAAAALRVLNEAFALDWDIARLAQEALTVGADGPACVHARPLRMRGVGEAIDTLARWPDLHVVLANAGAPVSTAAVFKRYAASGAAFSAPAGSPPETGDVADAVAYLAAGVNDLTDAAIAIEPGVGDVLDVLEATPGARLARLSGSGGACWAVFDDAEAAAKAAHAVSDRWPAWWVRATVLRGVGSA